jgi:hypothetical protein
LHEYSRFHPKSYPTVLNMTFQQFPNTFLA